MESHRTITKSNKGNKTIKQNNGAKRNWDVEIPQLKQVSSVNIYTLCGKKDKKEGNEIGSRYCEMVEQEGG